MLTYLLFLALILAMFINYRCDRENTALKLEIAGHKATADAEARLADAESNRADYWQGIARIGNEENLALQRELTALLRAQAKAQALAQTFEMDDDGTEPMTVGEADRRAAQARFHPPAKRPERPVVGEAPEIPDTPAGLDHAMAGIVPSGAPKAPRDA